MVRLFIKNIVNFIWTLHNSVNYLKTYNVTYGSTYLSEIYISNTKLFATSVCLQNIPWNKYWILIFKTTFVVSC